MRLLQFDSNGELGLTPNLIEDIPDYAILSHTWGADSDEVTFNDVKNGSGKTKQGYAKIEFCGEQARKDGLSYFWVDTCCIDQTNQVELAEAIVSMFRWYHNAAKCYVYLADVAACKRNAEDNDLVWRSAFRNSRWFTRGWTLQELLAPGQVEFYSRERKLLGDKIALQKEIHAITHIPIAAIRGSTLVEFSNEERMRWAAKRSTKRPEDKWYCLLGIFGVFMTPIYGEGDNAFLRLKDEIAKSYLRRLGAIEHGNGTSDSCGLYNQDAGSASVPGSLSSLEDHRNEMLESMSFDQMDSRRSTIKSAYATTCKWLLEHTAYLDWANPSKFEQHCGFLWINGKPGAGKSTLLKFAHANANKDRSEHEILISFFFNARGDHLERSTIGMYRALLFQLLNEVPDLQEVLDQVQPLPKHLSQGSAWTIELLCELFSSAVVRLGQRQLKCFIDALDECDEQQVRDMIDFLEGVSQKALESGIKLYTCFASRHYPTIEIRSGQQLTLEDEQGHSQDLAKYVHSHLRAGKGKDIEKIKTLIQEKANGVFMWAVLLVPVLNKEFLSGRIFAVKKRLDEVPAELSDLFKHILRRDQANMPDFLLCLQWILFARRPLKREEFYFAMVAGIYPEPENMTEWNQEDITVDDMSRFVLSSSKGLAELTRSKTPTVQFIHESVRDFLIQDKGLHELWPEYDENFSSLSHDRLKQCCMNYLNVDLPDHVKFNRLSVRASSTSGKDVRRNLTGKFPFLEYASQQVLYHADEAASEIPQDQFLNSFALSKWVYVNNLLEPRDIRLHSPDATLLYVLAEYNCARLIKAKRLHGFSKRLKGERYHYPLFAGLANGHRDAVRALLQQDEASATEDLTANLDYGSSFLMRKHHDPLLWALERGHAALAEHLLRQKSVHPWLAGRHGRELLVGASSKGQEGVVKILLKYFDIDADVPGTYDCSPLMCAVRRGRTAIVALLLQHNADVEVRDNIGATALICAASLGRTRIVQLLLDHRANIGAISDCGSTSLIHAVKGKREEVVQLLLNRRADIECKDNKGNTALSWTLLHDNNTIKRLLLVNGANIDSADLPAQ